jgi:dTDP-4-dehydrorhamnose 3,5-epimerase
MIFEKTGIDGVLRVRLEPHRDDRGAFARTYCSEEFARRGLPSIFEQSSLSYNARTGTLRGMHYQPDPHGEAKFVRCVRGSVFDVAVDIRPDSATRGRWVGEVLSADNGVGLYIPPGFAHGFQTLEGNSDVLYQITPAYRPGLGAGVRWNDPAFAIAWPIEDVFLSERDATYPDFAP